MLTNIHLLLGVRILFFLLACLYTAALGYFSLINLKETPVQNFIVSDKLIHAGAYFGLVLIWVFYYIFNWKNIYFFKGIVIICVLSVIFGTFIEVLQDVLTTYRELDLFDILANTIGAALAGGVAGLLKESLIRLKTKFNLFFMKK